MKIADSYITTTEKGNKTRDYFYRLTQQALIYCGLVPLTIRAPILTRFIVAENGAKSDYYVISDDDCIPMMPDAVLNALEAVKAKPEIGMLVLAPKARITKQDLGKNLISDLKSGIMEIRNGKGIRIIKRGILPVHPQEWDRIRTEELERSPGNTISDNQLLCEIIRQRGFKVALDTNNYCHHLGEGYSVFVHDNLSNYES